MLDNPAGVDSLDGIEPDMTRHPQQERRAAMSNVPPPKKNDGNQLSALTNAERLRASLAQGSLASALFAAWEAGDSNDARSRMLAALHDFYEPKQVNDDQAAA